MFWRIKKGGPAALAAGVILLRTVYALADPDTVAPADSPPAASRTEAPKTTSIEATGANRRETTRAVEQSRSVAELARRLEEMEEVDRLAQKTNESQQQFTNLLLGLIALLLAVVGLLIPLVTYFTSILPGNRLMKEARATIDNLEQRFSELTSKHQDDLIEKAIASLRHEADYVRQSGISFLAQNSHHEFSERQIFDICNAAREAPPLLRPQLIHAVAGRDSKYVTELISDLLSGQGGLQVVHPLGRQWSATRDQRLYSALRQWLTSQEMRHLLGAAVVHIAMASSSLLGKLIDDESFLSALSLPQKATFLTSLRNIEVQYHLEGLQSSVLATQLAGERHCFVPSRNHVEEVPPDEAELLIRFQDGNQVGVFIKQSSEFRAAANALTQNSPSDEFEVGS